MMRRGTLAALVGLAGATTLIAGCTTVPQSSSPQVVRSVGVGGGAQAAPTVTPAPGVQPSALVQKFLSLNSANAGKHASARTFLTPTARSRWTDTTVTVVSSLQVGGYTPGKPVVATATQLGSVDANGVYTPMTTTGKAAAQQFAFGIAKVDGQYRINSLNSGLVLTETQFVNTYVPRNLYFFDLAHRYLVPDVRWTPDTDPVDASEVLVNLLAGAPSGAIKNAVATDTLPAQSNIRHIDVSGNNPLRIEISGASQLAASDKSHLAAQIAATLADVDRGRSLEITDGGSPITIPESGSTDFSASDFNDTTLASPVQETYYVRNGQIVDGQRRTLLGGRLNDSRFPLTSIAVSRSGPTGNLSVAGVTVVDGSGRLVMGTQSTGLRRSSVSGVTSRPAFAPGMVEAWVGAGSRIFRNDLTGSRITSTSVPLQGVAGGQTVVALRLSPEGSRVGVVLRDRSGHQQLYIGAVVRSRGAPVSVEALQQISPDDVQVNDLAWIEGERLNAIGYDLQSQNAHVYRTGADGSTWTAYPITGLPVAPTSLAGAPGAPAFAAAGSNVYEQSSGTTWSNPGGRGSTTALGSAPTYVE